MNVRAPTTRAVQALKGEHSRACTFRNKAGVFCSKKAAVEITWLHWHRGKQKQAHRYRCDAHVPGKK